MFVVAVAVVLSGFGFALFGDNGGRALSLDYFFFWRNSPKLYLYNLTEPSRNPKFWVNDGYRLAVSLKRANKPVSIKSCWIFTRKTDNARTEGCSEPLLPLETDINGAWHYDGQVIGISVGNWIRWLEINGQRRSTIVTQQVVCNPSMAAENCPK